MQPVLTALDSMLDLCVPGRAGLAGVERVDALRARFFCCLRRYIAPLVCEAAKEPAVTCYYDWPPRLMDIPNALALRACCMQGALFLFNPALQRLFYFMHALAAESWERQRRHNCGQRRGCQQKPNLSDEKE